MSDLRLGTFLSPMVDEGVEDIQCCKTLTHTNTHSPHTHWRQQARWWMAFAVFAFHTPNGRPHLVLALTARRTAGSCAAAYACQRGWRAANTQHKATAPLCLATCRRRARAGNTGTPLYDVKHTQGTDVRQPARGQRIEGWRGRPVAPAFLSVEWRDTCSSVLNFTE